ncbi:MAG: heme-binding protein [Planctomycetota bacterium]
MTGPAPARLLILALILGTSLIQANSLVAQQPQWIWSPSISGDGGNEVTSFFRKKFTLIRPDDSEFTIAAADHYQVFVNGRLAGEGESFGTPIELDVNSFLRPGVNLIAVRVVHIDSDQPGLAVKFRVKERTESRWRSLVSDATWKSRSSERPDWEQTSYVDAGWLPSVQIQFDSSGQSISGNDRADLPVVRLGAESERSENSRGDDPFAERFELENGFSIQQVIADSEAGSLIAMEFNEFGKLILSREGGPLLIADLVITPGDPNRVRVLCDDVNTCQGILPLNGSVYVTGSGPSGLGLYKLSDEGRDGSMEVVQTLLRFSGEPGEHGPHGLTLGPDGMIYVVVGNGSRLRAEIDESSPASFVYEGDLIPRFEDPGGHADGVKAPGGAIYRCTLTGDNVERVATGLRNSYDIVFDNRGELFTHDSDMESDIGMTWYRPTMVFHVPDGAEFGWRSGWSKFPAYFMDQTPAICDTGRGSPSGAVCYRHLQFPARYQNTIFLADWSEGRIIALHRHPNGASFDARFEEFASGKPLNVCDLTVGEDGALYFCTGGRGTAGGVFRIFWNGEVPEELLQFESDLERVVRHPQPDAAWARQNIVRLKDRMGDEWNETLTSAMLDRNLPVEIRLSAVDRLVLYGPAPTTDSVAQLMVDSDEYIRARAATLCSFEEDERRLKILNRLIEDDSTLVRVAACRAYIKKGELPTFEQLIPMLSSLDRVECMTARRVLERLPVQEWEESVYASENTRLFLAGSMTAMTVAPTIDRAKKIIGQCDQRMEEFINDADFIDMLRVAQLALSRSRINPGSVPEFASRISNEFPSGSGIINCELARLMAYLRAGEVEGRIAEYLNSDADTEAERLHVAMHLQHIGVDLPDGERLAVMQFLEQATARSGGGSYKHYIRRALKNVAESMTQEQVGTVLQNGGSMPNSLVSAFFKLPQTLDDETVQWIIEADRELAQNQDEDSKQARLGVIAVLAQSGNETGMDHLRSLWREEPDRRSDLSIGLAQQPEGRNWAYLVSSLPVLDDMTGSEIVGKLSEVNRRPRDAEHYRQVILLGYRLRSSGAEDVTALLEHWTGEIQEPVSDDWEAALDYWKGWFKKQWPEEAAISNIDTETDGRYSVEDVLSALEAGASGSPLNGRSVFARAQCGNCHRCGSEGTPSGPDLTSIASRFTDREIIQSIIHPSVVVSDQYRARTVMTDDGRLITGMAIRDGDGSWLITDSKGDRVRVQEYEVEAVKESEISSMPTHLIDDLTMAEIADLLSFLKSGDRQAQQNPGQPVR